MIMKALNMYYILIYAFSIEVKYVNQNMVNYLFTQKTYVLISYTYIFHWYSHNLMWSGIQINTTRSSITTYCEPRQDIFVLNKNKAIY